MKNTKSEKLFHQLYEITAHHNKGFPDKVRDLLVVGCERLGLEIGILSNIVGNRYRVVYQVSPATVALEDGAIFDLPITYCSITLASDGPVGFEHVARSEIYNHPAYDTFALESYIGIPVKIDNRPYGTLNFSSPYPRKRKFSDADIDALKLMSAWIEGELRHLPASNPG